MVEVKCHTTISPYYLLSVSPSLRVSPSRMFVSVLMYCKSGRKPNALSLHCHTHTLNCQYLAHLFHSLVRHIGIRSEPSARFHRSSIWDSNIDTINALFYSYFCRFFSLYYCTQKLNRNWSIIGIKRCIDNRIDYIVQKHILTNMTTHFIGLALCIWPHATFRKSTNQINFDR